MTALTLIAFLAFDLSVFMDKQIPATVAIIGFLLGPNLPISYEKAVKLTKVRAVGETLSTSLINVTAAIVSAIQHLIVIYLGKITYGMILVELSVAGAFITHFLLRKE